MQRTMQNHAAVFRTGESMAEGIEFAGGTVCWLRAHRRERSRFGVEFRSGRNARTGQPAGLRHGVHQIGDQPPGESRRHARGTIQIATTRGWMKHTLAWLDKKGGVTIDYRPVHTYTLTDEVEYIPPKKRTY